ncbi:hypothetical protein [Streptomyces sp. NPDC059466]|uniref:hypothetical protein n=1 Tax=unclassified Streptomyces TaxID=2593676 RepID=UPI0036A83487
MPHLDDLPPYRRAKLLWDFAHFGAWGVEGLVFDGAGQPCRLSGVPVPESPRVAVLGDDGRFHLMNGDRLNCSKKRTPRGWEHEHYCSWAESDDGPVETGDDPEQHQAVMHRWFANAVGVAVPSRPCRRSSDAKAPGTGGSTTGLRHRRRRHRSAECAPPWSTLWVPTATCVTLCPG